MLRHASLLPAAAAAVVLLLSGCASGSTAAPSTSAPATSGTTGSAIPSASASPLTCATSGSASEAVKVTEKGASTEPGVSFPVPTTATTTQRTVLKAGTGATIKEGDRVGVGYAIYDAASGKKIESGGWSASNRPTFPVDRAQLLPGLVEALNCTKEGERFAAVIPSSEAFGTTGSEQLGIGGGDALVLVAQVGDIAPTKATGASKALPSGLPQVTLAANGQPTVKIPATDPPKTLRIADSKVGDGTVVKDGDTVTVQYQGVLWRNGQVFDQSWTKSGPTSFATNQVVKGFGKALVGQHVGSQVVAIIPPSDGYGSKGAGEIKGTDTMVFVIDILATAHAS